MKNPRRVVNVIATLLVLVAGSSLEAQQPPFEGVRRDQMSDVAIRALVSSPAYHLVPGELATIRVEVLNRARSPVPDLPVALYAGRRRVALQHVSLEAGGTTTVQLPWIAAGQALLTLTAVVDPDRHLTEERVDDNMAAIDVVLRPPPPSGADFRVNRLRLFSPPDGPAALRATVFNKGSVPVEAPLVFRVDGQVVAVRLVRRLDPGASVVVEMPWPAEALPAVISAEVNPRFRGAENKPDDNLASLDLRPPGIDLRVAGLSVSAALFEAQRPRQVSISFRVVNAGTVDVTTPFRTRIFPGAVTANGLFPIEVKTPKLAAGQTVSVTHTIVVPVAHLPVTVEVDPDRAVADSDRSNNVAASQFQGGPAPDVDRWGSIGPRRITHSGTDPLPLDSVGVLFPIAVDLTSVKPPSSTASTLYVASHRASGAWKTTDGGASWEPIADSLGTLAISAIAVSQSDPRRVYLATPDLGVFSSGDGGMSSIQISGKKELHIPEGLAVLLVDPKNPDVLYLASSDGVYRSDSGGKFWILSKTDRPVTDLVMNVSTPGELYAAVADRGVYKTTNGGVDWISTGLPATGTDNILLAQARNVPKTLYALLKSTDTYELYRTMNADSTFPTWEKRATWDEKPYIAAIGVDPSATAVVYFGGVNFYRSLDGGHSMTEIDGPHPDLHSFATDVSTGVLYTTCDGGIYRSLTSGSTWSFLGEGIENVEFYDHAIAATDRTFVIGGTQDNGTIRSHDTTGVWTGLPEAGGDGATVDINPKSAGRMLAMDQFPCSLVFSDDGGNNFRNIASGLPTGDACLPTDDGCRCRNFHFQFHPITPYRVLASCHGLWRHSLLEGPFTERWHKILPAPTDPALEIVRSAVDPTVDLYYAGSNLGSLYAGVGGESWSPKPVFSHPKSWGVTDIELDPDDPTILYASFAGDGAGGSGSGRVFQLQRFSPAPGTLATIDITSDLPLGLLVRTLAIDRSNPGTLYAGTASGGMYRARSRRSARGGIEWSWTPYNNGLPEHADIRDLEVDPTTGIMSVATHGRGAYQVRTKK